MEDINMSKKTVLTLVIIFAAVFVAFAIITNLIFVSGNFKEKGFKDGFKGERFEVNDSQSLDLSGVELIDIDVVSSDV